MTKQTLNILFPTRLIIPFLVILFSISVIMTDETTANQLPENKQASDSTFIEKLVQPFKNPPPIFKK